MIADLSALFGVERGAVEKDCAFRRRRARRPGRPSPQDHDDLAVGLESGVTVKSLTTLGRSVTSTTARFDAASARARVALLCIVSSKPASRPRRRAPTRSRARARRKAVVSCSVNASSPVIMRVQSAIASSTSPRGSRMPRSSVRMKFCSSVRARLHVARRFAQLGIAGAERHRRPRPQLRHELARVAEDTPVTNRAPDQEAQHVAAVGIRGIDAVRDQERNGARVIGDDAPPLELLSRHTAFVPTAGCAAIKSVKRSVSYIETLPLRERENALEPGTGVDRLARQLGRACRRLRDCTVGRRRSKSRRSDCLCSAVSSGPIAYSGPVS